MEFELIISGLVWMILNLKESSCGIQKKFLIIASVLINIPIIATGRKVSKCIESRIYFVCLHFSASTYKPSASGKMHYVN